MLRIFVDADACPVKPEVYRVAHRYQLSVTLVAGVRMRIPESGNIDLQVVGQGMDAADDWIVQHMEASDIVITADIPLAARCVAKGAYVLGPTGKPFSEDNIGSALATRNLLSELREWGEVTGGPPPFDKRDRSRFLQSLDNAINQIQREKGGCDQLRTPELRTED
ncbi:MAG: YaiI/YqxD family protein [Deltaproteobacteria bacterium]|nr:YaiI/YqxD family protein [Deltaproteobacteria bacterium]